MRRWWALAFGAASVAVPSAFAGSPAATPAANYHPSALELAYRAGEAAGGKGDVARAHYQRGIDMARAILRNSPDDPNALLWLGANLGGEALARGKLQAFRTVPEIESTFLHLERVAPMYDHAAAARALANLYWKAPSVISVGSSKKAAQYFQLALARAPDFPGNQAMAAAFFADNGDCGRARPLAQTVAARTDLESYGPDAAEWRTLARDALKDCR